MTFFVFKLDRQFGEDGMTSFVIVVREATETDDEGFIPADKHSAKIGKYRTSNGWSNNRQAVVRAGLTEYAAAITKAKKTATLLEEELESLQLLAKVEGVIG